MIQQQGNIKYICVQPRLVYYAWQIEVMLTNFAKYNVIQEDIQVLIAYSSNKNDKTNDSEVVSLFEKIEKKFDRVNFFYYEDKRVNPIYISSIRPNILKQHFEAHNNLTNEVIFYHDCDIVFTKEPNFEKLLKDNSWYLSDTKGYIGYNYIKSKGIDVYESMCNIVGIDLDIPIKNDIGSGGAQYIIKNVDSKFWEKVEIDCEKLYRYFSYYEISKKEDKSYHPIQKWTSDMWSVLWNAWYFGHETKIDEYLNFTWATDPISKWSDNLIYHNAGVVGPGNLFFKGEFINKLPFNIEDKYDKNYSSYNYFTEIKQLKTCLI